MVRSEEWVRGGQAGDYELAPGDVLWVRSVAAGTALRCLSGSVLVGPKAAPMSRGDVHRVERDGALLVRAVRGAHVLFGSEAA